MIVFKEFIEKCQNKLAEMMNISSPEELFLFHQKLKDFAILANNLYKEEWLGWKVDNKITPFIDDFKELAIKLASIIDTYEIDSQNNAIIISLDGQKQEYRLIDPINYIKINLYDKENIFLYILIGEIFLDENFDIFQLYHVAIRMRNRDIITTTEVCKES